ncbi:MAG: hypothetical protein MUO76_13310, partial [Anaerolineaceae bacterium]|nr:hypothetical protein [Anaerolineaceae bacterium]
RDVAKEVSQREENRYPGDAADYIKQNELAVFHRANTSHKGGKGADDGNKPVRLLLPSSGPIDNGKYTLGFFHQLASMCAEKIPREK